jgi:calcineurin-like phosphoesterase family protein
MQKTFFTSDLHLNHARILELCPNRPFSSVPEMNEILIDNWNCIVSKNDIIYFLGDLFLGPIDESLELVKRLNGIIIMIAGNHDRPSLIYHKKDAIIKSEIWKQKYLASGIHEIIISNSILIELNGIKFKLSHFPYIGDHISEDRFLECRPKYEHNTILLHGHIHDFWKINGNMINVGVDVWEFKPVTLKQLSEVYHECY